LTSDHLNRIYHFKGNPREIGFAAGRKLGNKLEQTVNYYIANQPIPKDMEKLHTGALTWLRSLPHRFQEEFEGQAEGANIPVQLLAEFDYIEECDLIQCSGAIYPFENTIWVARNNDSYVPELWGYVTIREVEGRIPTINFGMEGDIFTPTGINKEKLWLHYNFLSAWDQPALNKPHVPAYVFLTEALELCRDISDVEKLLNETDRDGGMLLFAVDGKKNEFALFECLCTKYYKREPAHSWIVGTNHFCACEDLTLRDADKEPLGTISRFTRMENLIQELSTSQISSNLPAGLIRILADDQIERQERQGKQLVTVYSNVACPSTGEIWYTFGGYPAASKGNWQRLEWPWID
jgi:Acyl-coenzyme A:6-aminopenicillanic acid acyl-transferase